MLISRTSSIETWGLCARALLVRTCERTCCEKLARKLTHARSTHWRTQHMDARACTHYAQWHWHSHDGGIYRHTTPPPPPRSQPSSVFPFFVVPGNRAHAAIALPVVSITDQRNHYHFNPNSHTQAKYVSTIPDAFPLAGPVGDVFQQHVSRWR